MSALGNWKRQLRHAVDYPWDSEIDSDHPTCPMCKSGMDFYGHDSNGDFPAGEGYWECEQCGYKITENDI